MSNSTNIGDLNVTLSLTQFELMNGLAKSKDELGEFAKSAESNSLRVNKALDSVDRSQRESLNNSSRMGGGGGGARAVQQIGFGIQDFASQFETRGLSGGIGAVTNNVQMLGAAFGPAGLAATAFGGAIAGIVLPKLIEANHWVKDGKKELEEYTKSLSAWSETAEKVHSFGKDAGKGSIKGLDDGMQDRAKDREFNLKQIQDLQEMKAGAEFNSIEQKKRIKMMSDRGGMLGGWIGQAVFDDGGSSKRAAAIQSQIDEHQKKLGADSQLDAEALKQRPALIEKQNAQMRDEDAEARRKRRQDYEVAGLKAIDAVRKDGLDKYSDDFTKMTEKHKRERISLVNATVGLKGSKDALNQLDAQQAIELQKNKISGMEKYIASLGPGNGPSSGVDLNSSEGISALNKAMSGKTEQDVAKEQLEVMKQQLATQEALLGLKPEYAAAAQAMMKGKPELGVAEPMDSLAMNGKKNELKKERDPFVAMDANTGAYDAIAAKREREAAKSINGSDNVNSVLDAKKDREFAGINSASVKMDEALAAKRQRESELAESGKRMTQESIAAKREREAMNAGRDSESSQSKATANKPGDESRDVSQDALTAKQEREMKATNRWSLEVDETVSSKRERESLNRATAGLANTLNAGRGEDQQQAMSGLDAKPKDELAPRSQWSSLDSTLDAKRERERDSTNAGKGTEQLKVALEQKKILEEISRKPATTVVALSG